MEEARYLAIEGLDSFDFAAHPFARQDPLVPELAHSVSTRRENIIAVGNSGTGKPTSVSGSVSRPARRGCRWASTPPRLSS